MVVIALASPWDRPSLPFGNGGFDKVETALADTPGVKIAPRARLRLFALVFIAYFAAAWIGLQWAVADGAASPIWPAAGVGLAVVILFGRRAALAIPLALFAAAQVACTDGSEWKQLVIGVGNAFAALAGAAVYCRIAEGAGQRLATMRGVVALGCAALVEAVVSAIGGIMVLTLSTTIEVAAVAPVLLTWLAGNAVGALIVGALLLTCAPAPWRAATRSWPWPMALVIGSALLAIGAYLFFGGSSGRAWMIYPALVWAAMALGPRGATIGMTLTALMATAGALYGLGPFAFPDGTNLFLLQAFLAVSAITIFLLAAAVDERDSQSDRRRDAEAERLALELNRESERRLSLAMEAASIGMWDWNLATGEVEWSPECYHIFGLAPGQFEGTATAFQKLVHPDDIDALWRSVTAAIDTRGNYYAEFRIIRSGTSCFVNNAGRAIYDDDGTPLRMLGTISDISERKQAEAELVRLAQRAELAQRAARSSLYELDVIAGTIERDGLILELAGYEPDEIGTTLCDWTALIHPDDHPDVVATVAKSCEAAEQFAIEYRIRTRDGGILWVADVGRLIRDAEGVVIRVAGIASDITARKEQAQTLADRTAELETLLTSAPIGLAYFDREGRYVRINEELARANGVPVEAHLQRTVAEALGHEAPNAHRQIEQVFATGEPIGGIELDGHRPFEPNIRRHSLTGYFPVRGPSGDVQSVGVWVIDITGRKQAEERELMLAREVDHRAKNLLAVVQSVVQLSRADDIVPFRASVIGRIQSLARAHSLLSAARWEGVGLADLVGEELAAYTLDRPDRVAVDGPALQLRPAAAQSLALTIHELATNAAKYGALREAEGRLDVRWARDSEGALTLIWRESGSAVTSPSRQGFGTRVIAASIERQLGGMLERRWHDDGLEMVIRLPAGQLVDSLGAPLEEADAEPASAVEAVAVPPPVRAEGPLSVLVVEDEALIGLELEQSLSARGIVVIGPCATIAEALDRIAEHRPDAALLDLNLGGEMSFAVAEALLALGGVRIVFCTGYDGDRPLPPGLTDVTVLRKPFDLEEVITALTG